MSDFPSAPIPPKRFMEEFVPRAMAESGFAESAGDIDVELGVRLEGEEGGEWVIRIARATLTVTEASRDATPFTLVQTVADWRGALWEGRGGVFGAQASAMFRGDSKASAGSGALSAPGAAMPSPAVIGQFAALDGLIQIVVIGGEGGDWSTGFKLGPGSIPAEPKTKIVISAQDAEAMQNGSLEPMQAFMGGKIQVIGDMALMMQMQAISMVAAAERR